MLDAALQRVERAGRQGSPPAPEEVGRLLMEAARESAKDPERAYTLLRPGGTNAVSYLGPPFFTKFLYFAGAGDPAHSLDPTRHGRRHRTRDTPRRGRLRGQPSHRRHRPHRQQRPYVATVMGVFQRVATTGDYTFGPETLIPRYGTQSPEFLAYANLQARFVGQMTTSGARTARSRLTAGVKAGRT